MQILKDKKTKLYSSQEVANEYSELSFNIVQAGDNVGLNGITVEVVKAVHGYNPLLSSEVHENIGYIVDDKAIIPSYILSAQNVHELLDHHGTKESLCFDFIFM